MPEPCSHNESVRKNTVLVKRRDQDEPGYAMAGLLVMLGIASIMVSMVLPVWSQAAKRELEAELIFRGEQYARSVELYQRQNIGAYAADFETLVEERFLRRLYKDPVSEDGRFQVIHFGQASDIQSGEEGEAEASDMTFDSDDGNKQTEPIEFNQNRERGGVVGVVSRSDKKSLRVYKGSEKYNQWTFVYSTETSKPSVATVAVSPELSGRLAVSPFLPKNQGGSLP